MNNWTTFLAVCGCYLALSAVTGAVWSSYRHLQKAKLKAAETAEQRRIWG